MDEPAKPRVTDLHGQMNVIFHPAVRVHSCVIAAQRSCQEFLEQAIVRRQIEDGLLMVPSEDDVIKAAGDMHTWRARHRECSEQQTPQ